MDEVLFRLAFLLTSVKKEDQAREFFHRLIKDYPNSKYIPDAYLSFAEFYFDKGEMENALKFYEKVEQFPKSSVYPYAVYKKGWCYINLGDYKDALETFVGVVRMTQEGKVNVRQEAARVLAKEAKKDIVKAYSHVGGPDKAWEFFQRTGGDFAPKMMESLAELYWQEGKFVESSRVYKKVIAQNMDSPRICEWQNKIVRNTLSAGTKRDQVQEIERLGAVYDKVGEMKTVKKDQMEECRNAFHDTAKELALIWHKEAQKTKNNDTYELDKYVYKVFLDHFPKDKDAYEMAFYYGELLWTLENWKDAAEQYTKVVEMKPDGKYVKEAAYAAVLAWKNALNVDDHEQKELVEKDREKFDEKNDKKKIEPLTIPEYQKKMIGAFDTYIKYVPDAPELVTIKYRKARIFYEYNHFDEASKLFEDIVNKHPKHELAVYSANLLLDSLNAQGKTKDVVKYVDKFLEMPELMKDPEFGKQMISLKSDTYDMEGHASTRSSATSRSAAARCWPPPRRCLTTRSTPSASGTPAQCFQNAHLVGQALKARLQLIKEHPKDALAQKALFRVAAGYHQLAYYSKAAEYYEDFANKFPGEKKATDALGNATTFRIGLGESDKAIADMDAFVKFYGTAQAAGRRRRVLPDGRGLREGQEVRRARQAPRQLPQEVGRPGRSRSPGPRALPAGRDRLEGVVPEGCRGRRVPRGQARRRHRPPEGLLRPQQEAARRARRSRRRSGRSAGRPPARRSSSSTATSSRPPRAQEHFQAVLKIWNKGAAASKITGKDVEARAGLAAYAVAGAAFHMAEAQYEDFLRIKFPEGLDFQQPSQYDTKKKAEAKKKKAEESVKKFSSYLDEKSKALRKARDACTSRSSG